MSPFSGGTPQKRPDPTGSMARGRPQGWHCSACRNWMIAMRHDPFGTRLRHGLMASVCGVLLALGSVGAVKAQQAESDDDSFEQRIIKGILGGLGVDVGNKRGIEYRERSPLVIPPSL